MQRAFSSLPYFSDLPADVVAAIEARSRQYELQPGVTVIQEGAAATSMYFLATGAVRVIRAATGEILDTIAAPTLFGEMAIVADTPRLASVVTESRCEIFEVSREDVNALSQYPSLRHAVLAFHRHRLMSNILRSNRLFASTTPAQREEMARAFVSQAVEPGHVFLAQGQPGVGLFVVLRGTCQVVRADGGTEVAVTQLAEGDIFGEISLVLFDQLCTATVRASSSCVVLFLDRDHFQKTIMSNATVRAEIIKIALERMRANKELEHSKTHLI